MKRNKSKSKVTQSLLSRLKKVEWSKKFCALIAAAFGIYGVWCGIKYYYLCERALELCGTMPDATLAVVCVSTVIASLVSYLLYQAGLKNSRNKYGIDATGQPFKERITNDDMCDDEENAVG